MRMRKSKKHMTGLENADWHHDVGKFRTLFATVDLYYPTRPFRCNICFQQLEELWRFCIIMELPPACMYSTVFIGQETTNQIIYGYYGYSDDFTPTARAVKLHLLPYKLIFLISMPCSHKETVSHFSFLYLNYVSLLERQASFVSLFWRFH